LTCAQHLAELDQSDGWSFSVRKLQTLARAVLHGALAIARSDVLPLLQDASLAGYLKDCLREKKPIRMNPYFMAVLVDAAIQSYHLFEFFQGSELYQQNGKLDKRFFLGRTQAKARDLIKILRLAMSIRCSTRRLRRTVSGLIRTC
jgi:hypothetical protein